MSFLFRRLLHVLAVVAISTSLGFFVLHVVPGDPLGLNTEQSGRSAAAREQLQARYGLDQPITQQYVGYVKNAVTGNWGASLTSGRPVVDALRDALANSLLLSGTGLLLAIVIGMSVGALQGWRPRSLTGQALGSTLTALYVVPEFIVAVALIAIFSYRFAWFPIGGLMDPVLSVVGSASAQFRDRLWHLALPAITLAIGWGAAIARQQRNALVEVRGEDFVRTARAKGLTERTIFLRHVLPASMSPVVIVIGLMLPVLVGGAVVVETVFAWPGLGSLLLKAISARDYPLVSGAIVLTGVVVAAGSLLTDAVLVALNPRLRTSGTARQAQ
ncbi:MAG: ABC transporter permease [Gemmatimonadaceae bacterium]